MEPSEHLLTRNFTLPYRPIVHPNELASFPILVEEFPEQTWV